MPDAGHVDSKASGDLVRTRHRYSDVFTARNHTATIDDRCRLGQTFDKPRDPSDQEYARPVHLPFELTEASSLVSAPGSEPSHRVLPLERDQIIDALSRCGWNQTEAAQLLQVSRRTLVYRLKELDIPLPRSKAATDSLAQKRK